MAETPNLFTHQHAERMKRCAGQPYRPSNGMEGELFMDLWCRNCTKDTLDLVTGDGDGCEIIADTMCFDIADPEYPKAWTISERGQPVCSEFSPAPSPTQGA